MRLRVKRRSSKAWTHCKNIHMERQESLVLRLPHKSTTPKEFFSIENYLDESHSKEQSKSWNYILAVKSIDCSFRGPGSIPSNHVKCTCSLLHMPTCSVFVIKITKVNHLCSGTSSRYAARAGDREKPQFYVFFGTLMITL